MLRRAFRYNINGALKTRPGIGLQFNIAVHFSHGAKFMTAPGIKINKMDAARRQLRTAITMWFSGGDPVSAHALAYAAHEIIHAIHKKKNPGGEKLLFDADFVREEKRLEFNILLKRNANFFKHGDFDADAIIDFHTVLTDTFILVAIKGFSLLGEA
jgi:hypothetical protein